MQLIRDEIGNGMWFFCEERKEKAQIVNPLLSVMCYPGQIPG
jgi:hypothetical protein